MASQSRLGTQPASQRPAPLVQMGPDGGVAAAQHAGDLRGRPALQVVERHGLGLMARRATHRSPEVGRLLRLLGLVGVGAQQVTTGQPQQATSLHKLPTPQRHRPVGGHAPHPCPRLLVAADALPGLVRGQERLLGQVLSRRPAPRQRIPQAHQAVVFTLVQQLERLRQAIDQLVGWVAHRCVPSLPAAAADHGTPNRGCSAR
jgi:hypothetical protein